MSEAHPGGGAARLVGARALRRHSEHRWRRHLAESALPVARPGARAHDVHRRGLRVRRACSPRRASGGPSTRTTCSSGTTTRSSITARTSSSSATFQLERKDPAVMHRIMQENLSWRGAGIPGSTGIRAPARSSRRSRGSAPAGSSTSAGSRAIASATRRSRTFTPTSWSTSATPRRRRHRADPPRADARCARQLGHELEPEIGFIGEF